MHHSTTIDDAQDLDFVISLYNLLKYSSKYSELTGSLWFYAKGEATCFDVDIVSIDDFTSFKYKAILLRDTDGANCILRNTTIAVSLKYLGIFQRSLEMSFIDCKIE